MPKCEQESWAEILIEYIMSLSDEEEPNITAVPIQPVKK